MVSDAERTSVESLTPELRAELSAAREAFRRERDRERADLDAQRADTDRRLQKLKSTRAEVRAERDRMRATYRRFLKRMQTRWVAEKRSVEAARAAVERDRETVDREQAGLRAERDRTTAQLGEYKRRLYEAWQMLAENQRRLLADRQQAEAWLAQQTAAADRRMRDALDREERLHDSLSGLEARRAAATAEIVGLETRANNLRGLVKRLEEQRARGEGPTAGAVLLEPPTVQFGLGDGPEEVLAGLHENAQAVAREKAKLAGERDHLERRAVDLDDQRAILAEHVAALAAAREQWQANEHRLVTEMEELARQVRLRELAADDRERNLDAADARRREQEEQLAAVRERLEGWQAALAAYEAAAGADRDRTEGDLATRQAELQRRAAALEAIRGVWIAMRDEERAALGAELEAAAADRERLARLTDEADRARLTYLDEAAKLAAVQLAAAQAEGKTTRRERVLRRRWESRFTQYQKELAGRLDAARAECQRADARTRELHAAVIEATNRHAAATDAQAAADRRRLSEEIPAVPHHADTETHLNTLRAELERLSGLLAATPREPAPDVIPLRRAA